jgi:hypothetical protein
MANTSGTKKLTKTAFVKAQPTSLSAKEVIAKGKAAGIELTEKAVYAIRYEAKRAAKKKSQHRPASGKLTTVRNSKLRANGVEDLLRAAASEIGLSRAIGILQEQQRSLRSVLGG